MSTKPSLRLFLGFALVVFTSGWSQAEEALKVLTIGNSFANNATTYLEEIARAEGKSLILGRANLGGASFERHLKTVKAFEADAASKDGNPYPSNFSPERKESDKKYSLKGLLEAERWNIVTIQQVSSQSFQYESFEPFAGELINYIHKYAPQAEILIHQTWAYREDFPGYKADGLTPEKMYQGLVEAYRNLAAKYNLRVIPVGAAFQLARNSDRWKFSFPEPGFDYQNPKEGVLPLQKGSLNKGWGWGKNKETGESGFSLDFKHANAAGKYLGGQVWYEALFGPRTGTSPFVPEGLDPADAEDLRALAQAAVKSQPVVLPAKP